MGESFIHSRKGVILSAAKDLLFQQLDSATHPTSASYTMNIPLSSPDITDADIEAVVQVLRSPRLSLGPHMEEFEELVSRAAGQPIGIAVSSGTAGLHLCIRALGIGPGDEVILPSFTFIAAANAVRYEQAVPVFVDIDPTTLNLDPTRIEAAITPRTRAILVVHTFGVPAPMDLICAIALRHHLRVIEDACEALGAHYRGRPAGSFGDAAVFAFYPNKQITTGEGGLVVTADPALARTLRALRNHGRYPGESEHSILGFNYRLSELACALGCAQMRRLQPILAQRESVARTYHRHLQDFPEVIPPNLDVPATRISWFVYVIQLAGHFIEPQRDAVMRTLQGQGIACGRYFAPIHTQPAYLTYPAPHPLPVTLSVSQRVIALPFFNHLSEDQVARVAETLRTAIHSVS